MALQKYDARKTSEKHPDFQPLEYFFEKMKVNTNHLWWHTETIWPLTFLCSPTVSTSVPELWVVILDHVAKF